MRTPGHTIRFRVSPEQADALRRIADKRDTPIAVILGAAVTSLTGVPDSLPRNATRKSNFRAAER